MVEVLKRVRYYGDDSMHVYIDGKQYIALDRYLQLKHEANKELASLQKHVEQLEKENEAYATLLHDKLKLEKEE